MVFFHPSRQNRAAAIWGCRGHVAARWQEAWIAVMDATIWRRKLVLIAVVGALVERRTDPMVGPSAPAHETLQSIGRRLSQLWSERELTAIAARGEAIWDRLQPGERAALGRGYLRLHVDRPVLLDVAVPTGSIPFWLADRGFRATSGELLNPDSAWRLYRRTFKQGCIELGVNGLDRTPVAHYVVFIRPIGKDLAIGDRPVVTLDEGQERSWRLAIARPGVSAAFDAWKPFETLPERAERCRDAPGITRPPALDPAGHGPRLEDPRRFQPTARSGRHRLRPRSCARVGVDLADVTGRRSDGRADCADSGWIRPDQAGGMGTAPGRGPDRRRRLDLHRSPQCAERSRGPPAPSQGIRPGAGHGLRILPGRRDTAGMGALEDGEDRARAGPSGPVPLSGRCPDGARALGTSPGDGSARTPRPRFPHAGRRSGRPWKRADQLGPPLPARRAGLRRRAGDALRGQSRVSRCRPSPVSGRFRPAAQWPAGHRAGPGVFVRDRGRVLRRPRQHARRLEPVRRTPTSRVARPDVRANPGGVEARDVPPPGLSLTSLARYARPAPVLGSDLRQAPRQPGPPGTRPRLSEDLSAPRRTIASTGPIRGRFT